MLSLSFDCRQISSPQDFYQQLVLQYPGSSPFGNNLDALWDWLTGELPLPVSFYFQHLTPVCRWQCLLPVIGLIKEASELLPEQVFLRINHQPELPDWLTDTA